ncbi:TetR/AcrR family transcriptional regulator [Lichenibacterium minor]|uniref:TetR/AcrR family transcriptional regulator n=1 Tax=Lichenibacterium minor TaxID=2316528 RepID=UPI001FE22E64|nr:TetR/AcrR family transcriptional regulator [Lichenibacterium minor]
MTAAPAVDPGGLPADRHGRILDAAERCLVRNGFDRTTMQDIARQAAMSPANLYRYFGSKEALVVGLVEREHLRGAALVERLGREGDGRAAVLGVIDAYFGRISRDHAILRLGIWSEATRNPAIAALVARTEEDGRAWFVGALSRLFGPAGRDPAAFHAELAVALKGIVVSKAVLPEYDPAPAVARLRAALDTGPSGWHAASPETGS